MWILSLHFLSVLRSIYFVCIIGHSIMKKKIKLLDIFFFLFNLCQVEQAVAVELGDESKLTRMVALKPLDKQIIEHKDVNKVVIQLNTIISSLKTEVSDLLNSFSEFSGIWNKVKYIFNKICCYIVRSSK